MDSNPLPPPQSPSQRPLHPIADSEPRPGSSKGVAVDSSSHPRQADVSTPAHATGKKRKSSTLTVTSVDEMNLTTEWSPAEDVQPSSAGPSTAEWTAPNTSIPLTQTWSESATFAPSRALPSLTSPPISLTSTPPFARKLCTRKPLDRPPPIKRSRANSLPTLRPVQPVKAEDVDRRFKRPKLVHSPPLMLPSDFRKHTLQAPVKAGRPCSSRPYQPLAGPSTSQLKGHKSGALTRSNKLGTWIPMRSPPITLATLSTLEAYEILRAPQLRHDLLFDNLAFRPLVSDSDGGRSARINGQSGKGQVEYSARSRLASTLYWRAVATEVEQGCRCVRWEKLRSAHASEDSMINRAPMPCICGGRMKGATEDEWNRSLKEWPSRLPNLIKCLREIVLSLMAATAPCHSHYQYVIDLEKDVVHTTRPPLTTHQLVPGLYAALDSWHILNQARHHSFDLSIFQKLGAAMKVHCAPVRDKMVDDMVKLAMEDGKITEALQRCFDCVEVMKLDIANHQLQALRPWLTSTAVEYEFSQFEAGLKKSGKDVKSSQTVAWIRECVQREVEKLPEGAERERAVAALQPKQTYDLERVRLVIRGYVTGVMDLVIGEGVGADRVKWGMAWSSSSLRDGAIRYTHPQPSRSESKCELEETAKCPESLKLDAMRFAGFHTDIVDIAVVNMLLLGYRQVCRSRGVSCDAEALQRMRTAIADFLPAPSSHFYIDRDCHDAAWHGRTSDLTVIMATRAVAGEPSLTGQAIAAAAPAVGEVSRTLLQWVTDNLEPESVLFKTVLSRVRQVIQRAIIIELEAPVGTRNKPTSTAPGDSDSLSTGKLPSASEIRQDAENLHQSAVDKLQDMQTRFGLEPLTSEVDSVTKRLVRVAMFNLQVYGPTYESAFDF